MIVICHIILREWKRILRLSVHYWVLLVLPPVLFFFFAFIYNKQQAKELPVVIWDEDHSSMSRLLTFLLQQTDAVHIKGSAISLNEIQDQVRQGRIMGAIHFPAGMERHIKSHHAVEVTLYTNAAALVPAKLIYKEVAQVIITAGAGVNLQQFVRAGMHKAKAMALVQPVKLIAYTLYNPDFNYQQYLVPGLITVGMQMVLIMIAVLLLNFEWHTNTMDELVKLANGSAVKIIIGKTIAHLAVSWINFILIAGIIFPVFDIGMEGTALPFFVLYTLLAIACIGIGQMISAVFKDVMLAGDIALFYTSPAFVFSGFTFPRWAMPWYDQYYAHIMPYTAFLDGFFKVYFMGLSLGYVRTEVAQLLLFSLVTYPVAMIVFQQRIKKMAYAVR